MFRRSLDLLLVLVFVVAAVALAITGRNVGAVGVIVGLPLALFVPGYALTTALLPDSLQGQPNKILYSLGISFALTILDGLLLNLTPAGFQSYSWAITLGGLSFVAALAGLARRGRERRQPVVSNPLPSLSLSDVVVLMAAVGVIVGAYLVTRTATLQQQYPGFTQLWLLRAGPTTQKSVLVGVRNMEQSSVDYNVELVVGNTLVAQWQSLSLEEGEEWQQVVSLSSQQLPTGSEVEVNLYRNDRPGELYRHTSLYLQPSSS